MLASATAETTHLHVVRGMRALWSIITIRKQHTCARWPGQEEIIKQFKVPATGYKPAPGIWMKLECNDEIQKKKKVAPQARLISRLAVLGSWARATINYAHSTPHQKKAKPREGVRYRNRAFASEWRTHVLCRCLELLHLGCLC